MSVTIDIQDQLSPAIGQLLQNMQPARLHTIIARAASNLTRDHFGELDRDRPNKLGGKRTHFWREASRATTHKADESAAKVVIDHLGAALQYFGGDITPVESTYLTIPAAPEAHGKGPREFDDLEYREALDLGLLRPGDRVAPEPTDLNADVRAAAPQSPGIRRALRKAFGEDLEIEDGEMTLKPRPRTAGIPARS